jgi:hypothetical protein
LYFEWQVNGLCLTTEPEAVTEDTALYRMEINVRAKYKPDEMVVYSTELGTQSTFERWRRDAVKKGKLVFRGGHYYFAAILCTKPN